MEKGPLKLSTVFQFLGSQEDIFQQPGVEEIFLQFFKALGGWKSSHKEVLLRSLPSKYYNHALVGDFFDDLVLKMWQFPG